MADQYAGRHRRPDDPMAKFWFRRVNNVYFWIDPAKYGIKFDMAASLPTTKARSTVSAHQFNRQWFYSRQETVYEQ